MDDAAIAAHLNREQNATVNTIVEKAAERARAAGGWPPDYWMHFVGGTAYGVALELGLTIAVYDIQDGRRLLEWIRHTINEDDPAALAAFERQRSEYAELLR